MKKVDFSLMFVTDDRITDNEKFYWLLEEVLIGGATVIQLREKNIETINFYKRALEVKKICDTFKTPLIINDRLDIALSIDADGLHLGQNDMPVNIARKYLGKNKIIGVSVSNKKQLETANTSGADYIGLSPIFKTNTKTENIATPMGLFGLKSLKSLTKKPIICIGGINSKNIEDVISNGSDGVAIVSAISESLSPGKITKKLKNLILKAKR